MYFATYSRRFLTENYSICIFPRSEGSIRGNVTFCLITSVWLRVDSYYFESLLFPQLFRGENDSKESDEFQAKQNRHLWFLSLNSLNQEPSNL